MSIILFSRPIHSGKTTELLNWCDRQKNVRGILMPDINGSRKIMDIYSGEIFDAECKDADSTEPLTTVGRFRFYSSAFEKANLILSGALNDQPDWLLIDEAGKLELDGKGFYDAIKKISVLYRQKERGNLLITVRNSLVEDIISFFDIRDHRLIHELEELA